MNDEFSGFCDDVDDKLITIEEYKVSSPEPAISS